MSNGCLKCGARNAEDATVCQSCSGELDAATNVAHAAAPSVSTCRRCGHSNRPGARFCTECGADQAIAIGAARVPMRARPPALRWVALGLASLVFLAAAAWWFSATRAPPGPTFDSAPPPSTLAASGSGSLVTASPLGATQDPFQTPGAASAAARPPTVAAPVLPATPSGPVRTDVPFIDEPHAEVVDAPPSKGVREQPGLGEQPALPAEPIFTPLRSAPVSPRPGVQPAPYRATAGPKRAAAAPPNPSVQETCGNQNYLLRSLCEARECFHREHADEPACRRVKAAEERRRQRQESGG